MATKIIGDTYDVGVIGGGVFGLATALELAKRGRKTVLFDRLGSGHPVTSSTGLSRSIRIAYDQPFYVGLAQEALRSWRSLERKTGRAILHLTGQIDLGPPAKLQAIHETVRAAGGAIRDADATELRRLMPELNPRPGEIGLFHADGGTVLAEQGMLALAAAASRAGAMLCQTERVIAIDLDGAHPRLVTAQRAITAERIVIAAGPWSNELLAQIGLDLPLAPSVAQVTFLDAPLQVDRPGIAEWETSAAGGVYGHPVPGIGYKIAFDAGSIGWDGDITDWAFDGDEERRILDWLRDRVPGLPARAKYSQRHPWTMTPDADFVVDNHGPVTLACGCSGHAFKFGPALGRLVADIIDGRTHPVELRLDRPGLKDSKASATAPIVR